LLLPHSSQKRKRPNQLSPAGPSRLKLGQVAQLQKVSETDEIKSTYPMYVSKAEKKGRTKKEVDEIIRWLTGYSQKDLEMQFEKQTAFEIFLRKLLN
jgi:hypothetical protein